MGICDSLNSSKNKKINNFNSFDDTGYSTKNNYKNDDLISITQKSDEFVIPANICKRDDIKKYYSLSQKILGEGATGQVCIGQKNGKQYAIKRISKKNLRHCKELISEATISMQLKHENIMSYYEIFEDSEYISYVMDLGEGGDLFDFITGCPLGHLPADIIIELLIQIFDVVDYLHSTKKIAHRDLKPENFMIKIDNNNKPKVKLIDFGMAAFIPSGGKFNEFLGTKAYAAPEIFGYTGYNEKVDEWAIGVILFNMLTGYEPFKGEDDELLDNIRRQVIKFDIIEDIDLKELDQKLLERNVTKRITSKEALKMVVALKNERDAYFRGGEKLKKIRKTPSIILRKEQIENEKYNKYWDRVVYETNGGGGIYI